MIAIAKEKSYNKNIRPWRSWITQRIPIPEVGGSNPSGRAKAPLAEMREGLLFWLKHWVFRVFAPFARSKILEEIQSKSKKNSDFEGIRTRIRTRLDNEKSL